MRGWAAAAVLALVQNYSLGMAPHAVAGDAWSLAKIDPGGVTVFEKRERGAVRFSKDISPAERRNNSDFATSPQDVPVVMVNMYLVPDKNSGFLGARPYHAYASSSRKRPLPGKVRAEWIRYRSLKIDVESGRLPRVPDAWSAGYPLWLSISSAHHPGRARQIGSRLRLADAPSFEQSSLNIKYTEGSSEKRKAAY